MEDNVCFKKYKQVIFDNIIDCCYVLTLRSERETNMLECLSEKVTLVKKL